MSDLVREKINTTLKHINILNDLPPLNIGRGGNEGVRSPDLLQIN